MAVINLGNLKFTWKGIWLPSTAYNKDDIVKHGANVYVITQAHTSGTDFLDTDQYLELMTNGIGYVGEYSASTRYQVGDVVRYGSWSYICTQEHLSDNSTIVNPSVNTDYWDVLNKGQEWRSDFTTSSTYGPGDIVKQGGQNYICIKQNDGIEPFNTEFWSLLLEGYSFRGDWVDGTGYYAGDVVKYNANVYVAKTRIIDSQQTSINDDTYWYLLTSGLFFRDSYSPAFEYNQGDVVKYGGNYYRAKETLSNERPDASIKWETILEGINYRGDWQDDSSILEYRPGDLVKYGSQLYRVINTTQGTNPSDSTDWEQWSFSAQWRGEFVLQEYRPGDVVRLGGNLYLCIKTVEGVENPPVWGIGDVQGSGTLNTTYWDLYLEGIAYQGQWGSTTEYNINEVVEYGGGSFICQRPNVGQQPDLDASRFDWDLLVAAPEGNVLVAEGDMIVRGGVTAQRLPIGPAGSFLYSDGTTARWGHQTPQQTYYVSTEGDDTNDGRTPATAWRTLEHACEETYNAGQTMISVFAGTYEELTPIRVGRNVVIEGAGLGAVTISPDNTNDKGYGVGVSKDGSTPNANSDVFWMNNGCRLRNIVFRGFSTGSVCVSLDPGTGPDDTSVWITSQSPYVQNCTSFTPEGTGMWVDGARHNGGYKSMVANDWTQINSDGIGIRASSDARIELVSVFTYYCDVGYLAESGAKIRSVQGSSAYGEYGVRADGFSQAETPLAATLELTDDTLLSVQTQENAAHYFDIYKDSFGNVFATGFTDPNAANIGGAWQNTSSYPLVTKFNPDGSLDWSYTYENNFGAIHSAIEIDQSIYAAGVIYDAGQDKGFLLKISKTGEIQWQKVVTDTAEFVDVATDEVYLYAVGNHATQGASIIKVNAGGTLQWSRTLDTGAGSIDTLAATSCTFAGVPTTSTDSYINEGNANAANTLWVASRDATNNQARITLIDSTGAQTDSFVYGDATFNDIEIDTGNGDGIYALVGGSYNDSGTERPLLARIAMTGNVAWQSQWPIAGKILRTLPFGNDVYAVGYETGTPTRGLLARYTSAGAKDWIYELTDGSNEVALNGVALDGVNVIASGIWNDDSVLINVQRDVQFGIGTVTTGSWAFADGTITPINTTVIDDTQNTAYVQSLSVTLNNAGLDVNQGYSFTRTVAATRQGFAGIGTGINFSVAGLTRKPKEGSVVHIDGDTQTYFCIGVSNYDDNTGTAEIALDPAVPSNKTPNDATPIVFREAFSQVRMTGHDFLDIGTGGFADTNYPVIIAEDYTQPPSQARETQGDDGGRVFYVTTDQDGNFRVGDYFKVEQATGRATLSSEEFDLSGLNELQLGSIKAGKQGATVNEFSTDGTLSGNSDNAVPTERAVVTYITTKLASGDAVAGILQDATGATKIQVKETPNENVIRFDTSNTERLTIGATGQITAASAYVPSADEDLTTKAYVDDKVNLTSNANNSVDVNQTQADTFTVTVGGETEMTINTSGLALSNNTVRVGEILDEDTLASDSATALATQQSIKAYVDNELSAFSQNQIIQADSNVTVTDTGSNGTITFTADNEAQLTITDGAITANNGATFTGSLTGNADTATTAADSTNLGGVAASNYARTDVQETFGQAVTLNKTLRSGSLTARPVASWSASGNTTGRVVIKLPNDTVGGASHYGMIHMVVDVYEYNSTHATTYIIGGHNWNGSWYNYGAQKIGAGNKRVKLAWDGSNFCVLLGETTSGWTYGTVHVRKISNGEYYINNMDLTGDWQVYQTVTETDGTFNSVVGPCDNQVWDAQTDGPTSGLSAQYVGGFAIGQSGNSYIPYADGNGDVKIGNTTIDDTGIGFDGKVAENSNVKIAFNNTGQTGTLDSIHWDGGVGNGMSMGLYDDNSSQSIFMIGGSWNPGSGQKLELDMVSGDLKLREGQIHANVSSAWQQSDTGGTSLIRGGRFDGSISNNTTALKIFPASASSRTSGYYNSGIGFMHLDPENSGWGTGYPGMQCWIGMKLFDTPGQERDSFVIATNNNTSAGTMPTEKLRIDPDGTTTVSGTLVETSSITLKENINPITGALSIVDKLKGYVYDRKDGTRKNEAGLIAEEVNEVLPNVVTKDNAGNAEGVQYTKLVAYLIESIKELKAEIDELKGKK